MYVPEILKHFVGKRSRDRREVWKLHHPTCESTQVESSLEGLTSLNLRKVDQAIGTCVADHFLNKSAASGPRGRHLRGDHYEETFIPYCRALCRTAHQHAGTYQHERRRKNNEATIGSHIRPARYIDGLHLER